MEMNVKTSSRKVNGLIQQVKTSANRYNGLVQAAIVAIVEHANLYGDCTGAARLVEAMPRSNRRSLVIAHFKDYSPINVAKAKEGDGFMANLDKGNKDREPRPFNIDGVRANNWFERPEAETLPDVVTFESAREMLNKALTSMEKKAETSDDKASIIAFVRAVRSAASRIVTGEEVLGLRLEAKTGAANTDKAAPSTKVA